MINSWSHFKDKELLILCLMFQINLLQEWRKWLCPNSLYLTLFYRHKSIRVAFRKIWAKSSVASLFANVSLGQTISVQWQESWRVSDQAFSFWPIPARTQKPPAIYTLSNLLHLIRRVSRIIKCIVTSGCMTMNGHKSKISPLSPLRGAGFAFHSCLRGCYDKKEWDPFFDDEIKKQVSSSWETPLKITKYWCMAWQERGNSANPKGD